jgi:predicted pyridoxine 5'-phosphate oxidase superfamily flavin-nucleotide-binding protein
LREESVAAFGFSLTSGLEPASRFVVTARNTWFVADRVGENQKRWATPCVLVSAAAGDSQYSTSIVSQVT